MWLVKMFLTGIVLAAILLFAILNLQQEPVTVRFWFTHNYELKVQFIIALFGSFVLGAFVWFLFTIGHEMKLRGRISRLEKEKRKLGEELTALRNLPLEDVQPLSQGEEGERS
ncbi:MAG: LapA family protein [Candidatus Eisenbacteria bacterium]|nr:LapA family protein [Candidatus Eisenbacteria bacterium]